MKSGKHRIIRAALRLLSVPFYWALTFLIPRDKRLWVFGAWFGNRYSDNARYVFEYVVANHPDLRPVWLARDNAVVGEVRRNGLEAYRLGTLKAIWVSMRAGAGFSVSGHFVDLGQWTYGGLRVQLWHGTPLKKIMYDDDFQRKLLGGRWKRIRSFYHIIFPFGVEKPDLLVAPSVQMRQRFAQAFATDLGKVVATGSPRNDIILGAGRRDPAFAALRHSLGEQKIIVYGPTFRKDEQKLRRFVSEWNMNELEVLLQRNNAVLLMKLHYVDAQRLSDLLPNHPDSRLKMLTEPVLQDINYLLGMTDVLITDYSSMYFDFLALDRPIIFAPFDLDTYLADDRALYDDYNSATPGPKATTWSTLVVALDEALAGEAGYEKERQISRQKYCDEADTENCERLVLEVSKRLGIAKNLKREMTTPC